MSVSHFITGGLVHLSGNPIQITLTANAARANHKLVVKVTCAALMGSPFVEEIAPKNLVSVFDISGFIDQPVAYDFDFPAVGVVSAHPKQCKRIYLHRIRFAIQIWQKSKSSIQHGSSHPKWRK